MSKAVVLDDAAYEAVLLAARAEGLSPEAWVSRLAARAQRAPSWPASPTYPGWADAPDYMQAWAKRRASERGGTPDEHLRAWWHASALSHLPVPETPEGGPEPGRAAGLLGAYASGDPHSADNERIDADLAALYVREADEEPSEAPKRPA